MSTHNHAFADRPDDLVGDRDAVMRIVSACVPEDFDGHTEFHRLTPGARLEWLDAALMFIEDQRLRISAVAESPAKYDENPGTISRGHGSD